MQHDGEESLPLRFAGQQADEQAAQFDRLGGQALAPRIGAGDIFPPAAIRGVDGFEDGVESTRELVAIRDAKRDACLPDLVLRPREPLTHGSRRHEEG